MLMLIHTSTLLTDSFVSIYAGEFNGSIMSSARIFLVLFMLSIRVVAIGQSIVDEVDLMGATGTKSSQ